MQLITSYPYKLVTGPYFLCYLVTEIASRPGLISVVVSILALPDFELNFVKKKKTIVAEIFGIYCRPVTSLGSTFVCH